MTSRTRRAAQARAADFPDFGLTPSPAPAPKKAPAKKAPAKKAAAKKKRVR